FITNDDLYLLYMHINALDTLGHIL
ncbi:MAG: hypothetical protein H6Q68_3678, partial [Firmicutes bacterium]|nr:hypothetical protein [Bacillota bacterium]